MPELDPQLVIRRIKDNDSLLDILIQVEDFLDSLDLYAFKNWIDGEVVAGPSVTRYWISLVLKYSHKKMPDPQGAMRMLNRDVRVNFRKSTELVPVKVQDASDFQDGTRKPRFAHKPIWLIELEIPRRFIDDIADQSLEQYDDEVEVEDVEDAEDEGLAGEANLKQQTDEQGGQQPAPAGGAAPPAPGGAPGGAPAAPAAPGGGPM